MIRSLILLSVIVLTPGYSAATEPTTLPEDSSPAIVHLLNAMQVIVDVDDIPRVPLHYAIRLIRMPLGPPECDGSPESCPREIVYVAISTYDEAPDEKLYRLPEAFGWDFVRWESFPEAEVPGEFVVFVMKRKVAATNPEEGWWKYKHYEVRANKFTATIREMPPDDE